MTPLDLNSRTLDDTLSLEWMTVNKIGGYACSTVPGLNSRKYHGLLVASLTPPTRRMVFLSRVEESVLSKGKTYQLATNEYPGTIHPKGFDFLKAFSSHPYPRWAFQGADWTLEKSLHLIEGENTVCLSYTLLGGNSRVTLELNPLLALRGIHDLMYQWNGKLASVITGERTVRVPATSRTPEVFFAHDGAYEGRSYWYLNTIYRREMERGYSGLEDLWMPGTVRYDLSPGQTVHFVCSTDPVELDRVVSLVRQQEERAEKASLQSDVPQPMQALLASADQFVLDIPQKDGQPTSAGVMTQYPWSAPRGRDALIAFTGLFLVPKKFAQAKRLLDTFASKLNRGLMPSHWPEDGSAPLYRAADNSLWFINAAWQYLQYTGDENAFREGYLQTIIQILDTCQHDAGLGLSADAHGLLTVPQGEFAPTWMDAKIGDWLVTPRFGRTVEINALWYNALCIGARLAERFHDAGHASRFARLAAHVRESFNREFWNESQNCLYDRFDDKDLDGAIRPNQLLALSLPFAVLNPDKAPAVLQKVAAELLTPVGLRSLAAQDPNYKPNYRGNPAQRDNAHYQGSVFPWLLGPYVSAYLRVHGRSQASRDVIINLLKPCLKHLTGIGLGQLCELFDGDAPHAPGGALASAVAIGELLRVYAEDIMDSRPNASNSQEPTPVGPVTMIP